MPKLSLLPREPRFFAFFLLQAENLTKMARQLKDLTYIWQNVEERAGVLADMEQDGDAINHDIMNLLDRSLVPPFDREDISAITHTLDDIADHIHEAADGLFLYKVEGPDKRAKELADIILAAVLEVAEGISDISNGVRQPILLKRCSTINDIEHSGDLIYRAAQAELFDRATDIGLVKWREIYRKFESTINGCKTFANVLEGIAIKYG